MTPREQLLQALLVERYTGGWATQKPPNPDDDISTARRRRELAEDTETDANTA